MNIRKRSIICIFLTCFMLLGLTACGSAEKEGEKNPPSNEQNSLTQNENLSGDAQSSAGNKTPENLCDTWENAMGGSGPVEYEYIEISLPQGMEDVDLTRGTYTDVSEADSGTIRKVSKMTLKNESGYVWRIFEFEYHYDSPVDLYDIIRTYNANNELLYRVSTYYKATDVNGEYTGRIIKNSAQSFNDQGDKICEINYSGGDWLQFDGGQRDGVYDGSNKFCVFAYDSEGRKKGAREYQMDGIIVGHWEYIRENGVLTEVNRRNEYDGYSLYTTPEFDSEGRLTALNNRIFPDKGSAFTFTYDEQGRLTERTGFVGGRNSLYYQSFSYREDGTIESCCYLDDVEDMGKIQEGQILYVPSFLYDEKGRLTVEDHGYLIAGRRVSCWTYEYYEDGLISLQKEYYMGEFGEGEEPRKEIHYDESGSRIKQ